MFKGHVTSPCFMSLYFSPQLSPLQDLTAVLPP